MLDSQIIFVSVDIIFGGCIFAEGVEMKLENLITHVHVDGAGI